MFPSQGVAARCIRGQQRVGVVAGHHCQSLLRGLPRLSLASPQTLASLHTAPAVAAPHAGAGSARHAVGQEVRSQAAAARRKGRGIACHEGRASADCDFLGGGHAQHGLGSSGTGGVQIQYRVSRDLNLQR